MKRTGKYYIGRIRKAGILDNEKIIRAILNPIPMTIGKFDWSFTDIVSTYGNMKSSATFPFVFGHLSKYQSQGQIKIVDRNSSQQANELIPDLLIASAPFVYLPNESGIAYLHVWNQIQADVFARRFGSIIENTYDDFFVDCGIEPISDYRVFGTKVSELDSISELWAKVHPPNPLFGRHWKALHDYLKKRNASEVSVNESTEQKSGLNTRIGDILSRGVKDVDQEESIGVTDSAVLMAADGYGSGKVVGMKGKLRKTIRTKDTQESFEFTRDPDAEELAIESHHQFQRVSDERNLRHE